MFPVISHFSKIEDLSVWISTDNKIGTIFTLEMCDLESEKTEEYFKNILNVIRNLSSKILLKVKLNSQIDANINENNPRKEFFKRFGVNQYRLFISLETESKPIIIQELKQSVLKLGQLFNSEISKGLKFTSDMQLLNESYQLFVQQGLRVKPLTESEIKEFFIPSAQKYIGGLGEIATDSSVIGVIRLNKLNSDPLSESLMSLALKNIPKPFSITVSLKVVDEAKARLLLERKLKQTKAERENPLAEEIETVTTSAIKKGFKGGSKLIEYEFILTLSREDQKTLKKDLKQTVTELSALGDFRIETYGVIPSFLAQLVGNSTHVTNTEIDEVIPLILPLWTCGEVKTSESQHKCVLSLYREDKSVFHFDLFDSSYSAFNTLIVGSSGRGKSVLTGLLTHSLLHDPDVRIIKLDVGGSYSKECKLWGGKEFVMVLDESSGINPFSLLRYPNISEPDKINILARFLLVLIQEQNETHIARKLRAEVEAAVSNYLSSRAEFPSLIDFCKKTPNFPRRELLERWLPGGVYGAAFSEKQNEESREYKYRYYNFSQAFQASDPEFAQAGIAAVLAQFNTESLLHNTKKIVLVCDETPFFVKTCFEFFKFSTANVRKYGHAVVLISQMSTDFIVNDDMGIIENSPQRFLFSIDGDSEEYQKRFGLIDAQLHTLQNLRSVPKGFSEVLFKSPESGKKLTIKLTPPEYWRTTSSKTDQIKLEKLRQHIPELTLEESIRILSEVNL